MSNFIDSYWSLKLKSSALQYFWSKEGPYVEDKGC